MRDIKFRVWDNHYERYEERSCAVNKQGILFVYNVDEGHWFEPQHTGYAIEWFTGLKDKAGNEIFKGDILQTVADDGARLSKFTVYWREGSAGFAKERQDGEHYNLDRMACSRLEIIGNIHSNPELMEQQ